MNQCGVGVSANMCLESVPRGAVAVLDPARLAITLAGRGDDRRIHQRASLDRERTRLELRGDSVEQLPVQALRDERSDVPCPTLLAREAKRISQHAKQQGFRAQISLAEVTQAELDQTAHIGRSMPLRHVQQVQRRPPR